MSDVEVRVPFRSSPYRDRALAWVSPVWRGIGDLLVCRHNDGPWSKGAALASAGPATTDVVVVADGDVMTSGINAAIEAVRAGVAWAIPHTEVHRLTDAATRELIAGRDLPADDLAEPVYRGVLGGGIVVLRRDVYDAVPIDPRFAGWGSEDQAWARALATLYGRQWRGTAPLLHLWHPPQDRMNRKVGSTASHQLLRRYHAARRDPAAMRALLEEARACLSPAC